MKTTDVSDNIKPETEVLLTASRLILPSMFTLISDFKVIEKCFVYLLSVLALTCISSNSENFSQCLLLNLSTT